MSPIETLLSDAYHDAAQTIGPDGIRPAVGLPSRTAGTRSHRSMRAFAPLAAAAAVVVAIAAAVAVPRMLGAGHPAPVATSPDATSGHAPFIVQLPYTAGDTAALVIQPAGAARVAATVPAPHSMIWTGVAAAPPAIAGPRVATTTVYVAAATNSKTCVTRLYSFRLSASGKPVQLAPMGPAITGQLSSESSLAATGNGRIVAYGTESCLTSGRARVANQAIGLMTDGGATRQWMLPPNTFVGSLSLNVPGNELAYVTRNPFVATSGAVRILNSFGPSGQAYAHSRVLLAGHGSTGPQSAVFGIDGATTYIVTATGTGPATFTLGEYRSSDGARLRTLHTWRDVPVLLGPQITGEQGQLLVWGIDQPETFLVNATTGATSKVWMYTPACEFPLSIAW